MTHKAGPIGFALGITTVIIVMLIGGAMWPHPAPMTPKERLQFDLCVSSGKTSENCNAMIRLFRGLANDEYK